MAYFRPLFRMARGVSRLMRKTRLARRIPKFRPRRVYKKKVANNVHRYIRWSDKDTQFPGATGPNTINSSNAIQNLAYSFKLDNVVNPSDFVNLYDQYRINKITLYLERQLNQTGTISVNSPNNQRLRVVHDYNDNNPLTQEDDYLEYSNCKSYQIIGNGNIRITLYPKINNIVENVGGAASAFTSMNSNKVWLNINEDEVPHFGIKIYVPNFVTTADVTLFKVRARFDLSFKNSK